MKMTIHIDLGETGLHAGDACDVLANDMLKLKKQLYRTDDQGVIPARAMILDQQDGVIGQWELEP